MLRGLRKPLSLVLCATAGVGAVLSSSPTGPQATAATLAPGPVLAGSIPSAPEPLGVPGAWKLRFDDEFDGSALSLRKWQPNWLGATDRAVTPPVTRFDLNCVDPAAVTEADGVLTLSAASRSCKVAARRRYAYASGLINTAASFRFTFGYIEARIYVPADPSGHTVNFPAFWANGVGPWPASGELDVMEALHGCGPGIGWHFHSARASSGACAPRSEAAGWHVFAADWQPGSVRYFYDGRAVGEAARGVTSSPMYLVLDNSIDPVYGGRSDGSARLRVDYVRVWQEDPPARLDHLSRRS